MTAPPTVKTNLKDYPTNIKHEEGNIGKVFVDVLDIFTITLSRLRFGAKSANVLVFRFVYHILVALIYFRTLQK